MKVRFIVPIVVVVGLLVLFFFPEPETNFLAYSGVAFFFISLVIVLVVWQNEIDGFLSRL